MVCVRISYLHSDRSYFEYHYQYNVPVLLLFTTGTITMFTTGTITMIIPTDFIKIPQILYRFYHRFYFSPYDLNKGYRFYYFGQLEKIQLQSTHFDPCTALANSS